MQQKPRIFLEYAEKMHKIVKRAQKRAFKTGRKTGKNKTLYNLRKGVAVCETIVYNNTRQNKVASCGIY